MAACVLAGAAAPSVAYAQPPRYAAERAQILKADTDFARAVADRNREAFLSFLADVTTFNGGAPGELRGREAVWEGWRAFFAADGPVLSWAPTSGEVVGAGDLGYTTGRATTRLKGPDGAPIERHSEYLTVWRRQADGTWKVIFDTGSTLPPPH
jgi:ketosteroid isomerase-like protein